ncbi:MAG TPA: VWA domain-containing protein [Acidobacteriaceae bacterium]|nr:VWA domain-containing protein [Acidobacteriaceae bacterium]
MTLSPTARCLLTLLLFPAFALAQTTPAPASTPTTLQVTSRIVYVDVVVHDSSGHLVHGLTQKDFKVFEDGKPQQTDYFVAHRYDINAPHKMAVYAPKNQFSNVPISGPAGAVNILLFDLVNTAPQDQQYARKQMLKFLKALPPGQQVALFVLSNRLHLFQSFTGSSDLLTTAAKMINPKNMQLYQSDSEQMHQIDFLGRMQNANGGRDPGGSVQSLANLLTFQNEQTNEVRQRITLSAFAEIAHAAAGYPGRKNLYWLSGSFPFSVALQSEYNITGPLQFSNLQAPELPTPDYSAVQSTSQLIANSQIAVYPISVLGLQTGGVGVDVGGQSMTAMSGTLGQSAAGSGNSSVNHTMGDTLAQQFFNRSTLRGAMNDIAYQTGGEAVFGSNDIAGALRRTMQDGSNYYTLAYRPRDANWNGAFRKIKVDILGHHYSLTYRRGYFANTGEIGDQNSANELNQALQPGAPESTMLRLKSKLQMPTKADPNLLLDTTVDPSGVSLSTDSAGVRHGKLLVLLVALNRSDNRKSAMQPDSPPQTSGALHLNFTPAQYRSILKTGINFALRLPLKPGSYLLRLGVTDMNNHRLGTLDMPITIPPAA